MSPTTLTVALAVLCDLASATLAFSQAWNPSDSLLLSDLRTYHCFCLECSSPCFSPDSLLLLFQVSTKCYFLKEGPPWQLLLNLQQPLWAFCSSSLHLSICNLGSIYQDCLTPISCTRWKIHKSRNCFFHFAHHWTPRTWNSLFAECVMWRVREKANRYSVWVLGSGLLSWIFPVPP